ncbi:MAG: hemerythrin domain-containing protein [Candidatus Omnitrophica bacterium]|nr:hemerythrin domain-containing protein [Candidatus Omnitrophota bacterium]
MDAIDRLIREHGFLRSKLRLLESALGTGEEAWFVVREVSFTLCKELQAHCRREEKIFVTYRAALGAGQWTPVVVDRAAERGDLLIVKRFFMEQPQSFEALRPKCAEVIAELHRQMDQQETALFPVLQRFLALHHPTESTAQPALAALTETMSVQQVINRYPGMQRTFKALFIDSRSEGHDCLDAVAWRHGMESQDLLTALEEAAASAAAPSVNGKEGAGVFAGSGK